MSRRNVPLAVGAFLLCALALSALLFWPADHASSLDATAENPKQPAAIEMPTGTENAPAPLVLPVYRANTAGLPPRDAPLRESFLALKTAAENGNTTAACRLAFHAIQCGALSTSYTPTTERIAAMPQPDADTLARAEAERVSRMAARIHGTPSSLQPFVESRLELIEREMTPSPDQVSARANRCVGAPQLPREEGAALLRQAALAGQAEAVDAYASAYWLEVLVGMDAARTPGQPSHSGAWLRDASFAQWRREAAAIHEAGLEAGLRPSIEREAQRNGVSFLNSVAERDPVRQAAAVRALAALITGSTPPSTATLGLDEDQAADADRRSERWVAAANRRQATSPPSNAANGEFRSFFGDATCE